MKITPIKFAGGFHEAILNGRITQVRNCPTCHSPSPTLHPAMQYEGEVQRCRDDWHKQGGTR